MYLDNLYRKGKADLGVAAKASDSSAATGRGGEGQPYSKRSMTPVDRQVSTWFDQLRFLVDGLRIFPWLSITPTVVPLVISKALSTTS